MNNEKITKPYYTVLIFDNWHGHSIYFGRGERQAVGYHNRIRISNRIESINLAKRLMKKRWPCGMEQVVVTETRPVGYCVNEENAIFKGELDSAYAA